MNDLSLAVLCALIFSPRESSVRSQCYIGRHFEPIQTMMAVKNKFVIYFCMPSKQNCMVVVRIQKSSIIIVVISSSIIIVIIISIIFDAIVAWDG